MNASEVARTIAPYLGTLGEFVDDVRISATNDPRKPATISIEWGLQTFKIRVQEGDGADWTAPAVAVEPGNHFHTLYMRLAPISDALMSQMAGRQRAPVLPHRVAPLGSA